MLAIIFRPLESHKLDVHIHCMPYYINLNSALGQHLKRFLVLFIVFSASLTCATKNYYGKYKRKQEITAQKGGGGGTHDTVSCILVMFMGALRH